MASTKFTVVLDIPLTAAQKSAINKSIQSAVRQQIARLDNKGVVIGMKRIPPEWLGIWLKRFGTLDILKRAADFKVFPLK
jgi:hypothetical protein